MITEILNTKDREEFVRRSRTSACIRKEAYASEAAALANNVDGRTAYRCVICKQFHTTLPRLERTLAFIRTGGVIPTTRVPSPVVAEPAQYSALITEQQLIESFANAVAQEETWFLKRKMPTVAQRCNNPGCLEHWKDPEGIPYPEQNGFVVFPDEATGWKALRSQCKINILKRRLTWLEVFAGKHGVYRGLRPADSSVDRSQGKSNPARYAQNVLDRVCSPLGITATIGTPVLAVLAHKGSMEDAARPIAA